MTGLSELLAECEARGVRLFPADDDRLTIDAPRDTLTPDLLDQLKAHKTELLGLLRPTPDAAPAVPVTTLDTPTKPTRPVCRCGSTTWRDVPIHGGKSIRRDCGRCGRFIEFPLWYGAPSPAAE
jgi:hypothetical protein